MWQRTGSPVRPHSRAVIMHLPTISTRAHKEESHLTLNAIACKRHARFKRVLPEHPASMEAQTSSRNAHAVCHPQCLHKRGRKKRLSVHALACKLKKQPCKLAQVSKKLSDAMINVWFNSSAVGHLCPPFPATSLGNDSRDHPHRTLN